MAKKNETPAAPPIPTQSDAEKAAAEKAKLAEETAAAKAAEKLAAKAQKDADKAAKAAERAAAKAAKEAERVANRTQTVKQNGVSRPNRGVTLRVWEIADEVSKETKAPATRKAVTERGLAQVPPLEIGTIHTQYGRWRKFNGLTSVRAEPTDAK